MPAVDSAGARTEADPAPEGEGRRQKRVLAAVEVGAASCILDQRGAHDRTPGRGIERPECVRKREHSRQPSETTHPKPRPTVPRSRLRLEDRGGKRRQSWVLLDRLVEEAKRSRTHLIVGVPKDHVWGPYSRQSQVPCAPGGEAPLRPHDLAVVASAV